MSTNFNVHLKYQSKIVGVVALLFAALVFSTNAPRAFAQDAPAPEAAPAQNPAPAPEAAPAQNPAPAPEAAPAPETPVNFLTLERAAREKSPELFAKLVVVREFSKRLPNFWRGLRLTKKQTNSIYTIQKDYFDEISKLEARIKRLEDERDAAMRAVLTQKQRDALDAKLAENEQKRAARAAAKEAEEEARAEAEIAE